MESETKTFEPSGEVFEHRLPEMDSEYENFKASLIPEWQVITDKLMQTARGRTIMSDSRFCDYLRTSSLEIESIDEVISDLTTTPNQFRAVEHRNMYYRLPSLIDMTNRPHILSFIADGLKQEVDELDDYETKMVRRRRLASVQEELSVITSGEDSIKYAERALQNNREISESSLDLATSPRKLHARFAIYDMYFRDIIHNNKQNGLHAGTLATINEAQAMYYFELSEAIDTTRATDMSKEALSGSFGELLVLGRARDKLIDSGRFLEIEASQSYIRQDSSDKSNLVNPPKWKCS